MWSVWQGWVGVTGVDLLIGREDMSRNGEC